MSGLSAFMRSTMLLKSRVGLACLMTSLTSKPKPGSSRASRLAVPVPNSYSSWMIITVFAGLPATRVEHVQVDHRDLRAHAVAGAEAEGVLQPALDDLVGHADVHHVRQVVLGRRLRGGQADRRGVGAEHRRARRPRSSSRSRPRRPAACDCASPSSASIFAPPSDLMPPALLMSSMAISAPSRHCWPEIGQRAGHRVQHADLDGLPAARRRPAERPARTRPRPTAG